MSVSKSYSVSIMRMSFKLERQHWCVKVQALPQSWFRNSSPRNVFGIGSHLTVISVFNFQWSSCRSIHQKPPSHCVLRGESFAVIHTACGVRRAIQTHCDYADNSHNACLPTLVREVITVCCFLPLHIHTICHSDASVTKTFYQIQRNSW